MKHLSQTDTALLKKDFGEIWSLKNVRLLLILFPLLISVVLPVIFLLSILLMPVGGAGSSVQLLSLVDSSTFQYGVREGLFRIVTNLLCPMLFLSIPIIIAGITAANCFIGERERNTVGGLLLTPLPPRRIAKIKLFGCLALTLLVTLLSFLLFTITASIGNILFQMPFFLDGQWLITLFLLSPLLAALSALIVIRLSTHERQHTEAFRSVAYLMFPVILIYLLQFTGLYQLNIPVLLFLALFLLCLDFVLFASFPRHFTTEKMLG